MAGVGGSRPGGGSVTIGSVAQFWLILAVALTAGAILFGITVLAGGDDRGLRPAEPDGRSVPLPGHRPLSEADLSTVRFGVGVRGYRMAEVDAALRRVAYDIGYKDELIGVLEAEVEALRTGRASEAEALRRARETALAPVRQAVTRPAGPDPGSPPAAPDPAVSDGGAAASDGGVVDADSDGGGDRVEPPEPDGGGDRQADPPAEVPDRGGPERTGGPA